MIDYNHLHYWMCAIRDSKDPIRTLDAFWKGQIDSKLWLIKELSPFINQPVSIDIFGGWVGTLASLLFQSTLPIVQINSIDIDESCKSVAINMNKLEFLQNRFNAITADMLSVTSSADVVINTSCEHITQEQYNIWISNVLPDSIVVLQSNNYEIDEHIRIASSLDEFKEQSRLNVMWEGELNLIKYTRYMLIGKYVRNQ